VRKFTVEVILSTVLLAAGLAAAWIPAPGEHHVLQDVDGVFHGVLERMTPAKWTALFFVTTDCPIANRYAPEIQRICTAYGPAGTQCFLVYVDPSTPAAAVRDHLKDYRYTCCPAIIDSEHNLVRKAGATVSSEVAVFSSKGELKYRGRIDNFYAGLGTPRQVVTEHDLRDALDALIAGHMVRNPRTQAIGCFIPE
jgi:hypothetical protein